ncbi:redoxin family protein [Rheinheimera sp. MMS21-TC3]|uniref:redoxin family protein n=1 Tax=Rheinheimera sp. MMS21-TC3 TaxID=3072790 RepID=UPI0028C41744|nr:redoxin family protein [Rheinheimera sp. MMS21-TC3]WNO62240.1 redoxin family protein [Rheinheimera sp. MMS21-TC3]
MPPLNSFSLAPELETCAWFNTEQPLYLSALRGKVIVIVAFQMLCPGCVSHSLPQASALQKFHSTSQLQVIGLHAVFEHHHVMTQEALQVFIAEYGLNFAIAVDQPSTVEALPKTMSKLQLHGTPSIVLIDKQGRIRLNHFGHLHDLQLGSIIGRLLAETFD